MPTLSLGLYSILRTKLMALAAKSFTVSCWTGPSKREGQLAEGIRFRHCEVSRRSGWAPVTNRAMMLLPRN